MAFIWHLAYFLKTKRKKKLSLLTILRYAPHYFTDYVKLKKDARDKGQKFRIKGAFPVPQLSTDGYAPINPHYFFQDIWVAQQISSNKFKKCLDIGSRIDGYISILLAMKVDLTIMDIREPLVNWPQPVHFIKGDVVSLTADQLVGYDCISCLHVIEHIGLGKYGDEVNILGPRDTVAALYRAMRTGARLFVSSPVSTDAGIFFNAGRHLGFAEFEEMITAVGFKIRNRAFVNDKPELLVNPDISKLGYVKYGCLIFDLER